MWITRPWVFTVKIWQSISCIFVLCMVMIVTCSSSGAVNAPVWVDARDFPSFADCINSPLSAGRTVIVSSPMSVGTLTVPGDRDLQFTRGGMLIVAPGATLAVAGTLEAPLIQIFAGAGTVSLTNTGVREIYPQWWGARGDGAHDDTDAIQQAINAKKGRTIVSFPPGNYYCRRTIHVSSDRTHLAGSGAYATTFIFDPQGSEILFDFAAEKEVSLFTCSIKNMSFVGKGSSRKIALRLVNTSEMDVENISVYQSWMGAGSIGILMNGRELTTIRKVSIFADRPIVIEKNLSRGREAFIDSDHLHLQDLYLGTMDPGGAAIFIASGVNLTNFVLDGTNAFVLAKYGIYWNDTSAKGTSNNMSIRNVRCEQVPVKDGYAIYISHNYALQNLTIDNVMVDVKSNGFYLRNCRTVTLMNCMLQSPTGEALNVDASCDNIAIINCFFQGGATAKTAGLVEKFSISKSISSSPLPATAFLVRDSAQVATQGIRIFESKTWSRSGTLHNNEGIILPAGNGSGRRAGIITVAAFSVKGSSGGTVIDTMAGADLLNSTNLFGCGDVPGRLNIVHGSSTQLMNRLGTDAEYVVTLSWN